MKLTGAVLAAALVAVASADVEVQGYADPYCEGEMVGSGMCALPRVGARYALDKGSFHQLTALICLLEASLASQVITRWESAT